MADFKDRLWRDLEREHGDDLNRMHRSAPRRPRRRMLAAAAAGLAAAGTALLVALGTSGTPPAFAVDRHADGTVTVTINRVEGIRGANARLETLGINVRAVPFVAGCAKLQAVSAAKAPPALQRALKFARARAGAIMSVRIAPRRLERGKVTVLAARRGEVKPAVVTELKDGAVPQCVGTLTPAPPPNGRRVVCHMADGKTVPFASKQLPPAAVGNSGNSGASGSSGASGTSGGAGPGGHGVTCQVIPPPSGTSGDSGNSGASGVTGNS